MATWQCENSCAKSALFLLLMATMHLPFVEAVASPNALDICGDISAKRVFDVQWSGDGASTTQSVSGFAEPYSPGVGRLSVDRDHDFFRLRKTSSGSYVLQHFDKGGNLKNELSGGKVQLGNDDMLFYIIDGWYGTIITKSEGYKDGDEATFTDLTRGPALADCTGRRLANSNDHPLLV